jgi:hypothetical protein
MLHRGCSLFIPYTHYRFLNLNCKNLCCSARLPNTVSMYASVHWVTTSICKKMSRITYLSENKGNWHLNCAIFINQSFCLMKSRYTILSLIILLTSCFFQESLSPSDSEFRGSWDSRKYAIQIFSNGSGTLDIRNRGRCEGNVRIDGNRMIFISENEDDEVSYKRFHIDQRPITDSLGNTFMILDGYTLVKH